MRYSRHGARALGGLLAAGGLALLLVAVTGAGNDWLGGWLIRCGAKGMRHACGDGEVPWGLAFIGGTAALVGLLVACGEAAESRGRVSFRARTPR